MRQRLSFGCSNEFPPDITSLSNMMELFFYASELKPREGFNVRYEMVYDNGTFAMYFISVYAEVTFVFL